MKIVTLCGCGLGTCLLLKFTIEKILSEQGIDAEVVCCDFGSASLEYADIYVFPQGLEAVGLFHPNIRLVEIENVTDESELRQKLMVHLENG